MFALEWTLDHFFLPFSSHGNGQTPFKLVVVHAKPSSASFVGLAAIEVLTIVEADLERLATRVMEGAKAICLQKSIPDVVIESVEGDARNVLCDAVDKHHASILVVGSHGYGAVKRSVLGSVSDYCSHHAHCLFLSPFAFFQNLLWNGGSVELYDAELVSFEWVCCVHVQGYVN